MFISFKFKSAVLVIGLTVLFFLPAVALADECCSEPNNGSGTVDLPADCNYYSGPGETWKIIDGLPPDSTIEGPGILWNFSCNHTGGICSMPLDPCDCEMAGGSLGGDAHCFESYLELHLTGTGDMAGFNRTLNVPINCEVHTGPRNPGDPVQSFPADMYRLQGELFGDPDFCVFRVTGGTDYGLPSPGHTTLTELPSGDFAVDSFFDITYQIEFEGCPASPLDGMSGITTETVRILNISCEGCISNDNGGTIDFPPDCPYDNPNDFMIITEGLPDGDTLILDGPLESFSNITVVGGTIGEGQTETFDSYLTLDITGTGTLAGFSRSLSVPTSCEVHTGPRNPGEPVQTFTNDIYRLKGELFGDPDFCTLRVRGGEALGMPSPGQTTLTKLPSGDFAVDSFFDITYEIEFEGCPASPLEDMEGTTKGSIRLFTSSSEPNDFIESGTDYWATVDARIEFDDSNGVPVIPADFFGPGSDPFDGRIYMKGEPLDPNTGLADMVIRRSEDASMDTPPETIDIEIIALNLVSTEPIRVTYDGGMTESFFDVSMKIAPSRPSNGTMTITGNNNGGTFTFDVNSSPQFIFTPVGGGSSSIYEPASIVPVSTSSSCEWENRNPVKVVRPCSCSCCNFYPACSDILRLNISTGTGYIDVTHKDPLPMDFDEDGDVDFLDFATFAMKWLEGK